MGRRLPKMSFSTSQNLQHTVPEGGRFHFHSSSLSRDIGLSLSVTRIFNRDTMQPKILERESFANPKFTIDEIRRAIPPHCFKRSLLKSIFYMLRDLAVTIILAVFACKVYQFNPSWPLKLVFWPLYMATQGTFLTALWVVAHECGHSAFSNYDVVNDVVGCILHTALLVPYWSWKFSHELHHLYTNHVEKDQTHIPSKYEDVVSFLPISRFRVYISMIRHFLFGWPAYLMFNATGSTLYEGQVDHFNPWSPIFTEKQRFYIFLSDAALLAFISTLTYFSFKYGLIPILLIYFGPYLVVNFWLVLITKLHHHDYVVPHYGDSQYTYVKGQLATIDRSYGFVLDSVLHHINDTHIVHHLFSRIPHYNALEATRAIRDVLGIHYKFNDSSLFSQIWSSFSKCVYIQEKDGTDVWWFQYKKICN